jgi:hypothetical protein
MHKLKYFTGEWYADNIIMFEYLQEIDHFPTDKRDMGKNLFGDRPRGCKPSSSKYGTIKNNLWWGKEKSRPYDEKAKGYYTTLRIRKPYLEYIFKEFSNLYFKDFEWTDVTINYMPCGCGMKPHFDKVNIGDCVLCAFGDFTGGETFIQNKENGDYSAYDARDKILVFNGAERHHFVSKVMTGTRYSLVFYKQKKNK